MRYDDFRRSDDIDDRRDDSGGGGGGGLGLPMGGGGLGIGTIIVLGLVGYAFGIDPRILIGGAEILTGGNQAPTYQTDRKSGPAKTGAPKDEMGSMISGILGEIAALHPLGAGPDLEAWHGRGAWRGSADYELLEIRTTSWYELYGFAVRPAASGYTGLGGWRVTAKDVPGRVIVCVDTLEDELRVWGWLSVGEALEHRLRVPLGGILAIIEPGQLHALQDLEVYARAMPAELQL